MARVTPDVVLTTVERIMARPWDWARDWNCLGDAADVFLALWGVDPVPGLRGRVRTFGGARRLAQAWGGLQPMAEAEFESVGLERGPAHPGSIAIGPSQTRRFNGRAAMICVAPGVWAGKAEEGFAVVQRFGEGWTCRS